MSQGGVHTGGVQRAEWRHEDLSQRSQSPQREKLIGKKTDTHFASSARFARGLVPVSAVRDLQHAVADLFVEDELRIVGNQ
jgi:hypothetical protein